MACFACSKTDEQKNFEYLKENRRGIELGCAAHAEETAQKLNTSEKFEFWSCMCAFATASKIFNEEKFQRVADIARASENPFDTIIFYIRDDDKIMFEVLAHQCAESMTYGGR